MTAGAGMHRVLITGAAGFGGSSLARALLAGGYAVTGLDVVAPRHADLLCAEMSHPAFRYAWKSIHDIRPEDISGHSIVVHMAAQADVPFGFDSPRHTLMRNVEGTIAVLEAVRPIEYADYRPGEEGQREAFSVERARRELGYAPKVPPREAIALTAGWVRNLA